MNDEAVSEIKNVKYQALTQQLRDYLQYAEKTGRRFELYVRGGENATKLSKELQKLVDAGRITLKEIPQ